MYKSPAENGLLFKREQVKVRYTRIVLANGYISLLLIKLYNKMSMNCMLFLDQLTDPC